MVIGPLTTIRHTLGGPKLNHIDHVDQWLCSAGMLEVYSVCFCVDMKPTAKSQCDMILAETLTAFTSIFDIMARDCVV